jgi:hypothetical protein
MLNNNSTTSQVLVKFAHLTEYWLSMEISILSNGVLINQVTCEISAILCPFKSLIVWLESVVNDTKDTSFYWDAEGSEGMIGFKSSHLYVHWPCIYASDLAESKFFCEADKKQVIKAFYEGFRSFVSSEDYKPELYDAISLGEELAIKSYAGLTQQEIVGVLLTLSSNKFNAKLNDIRPFSLGLIYQLLGDEVAYSKNKSYLMNEWDSFNIYEKRKLLKTILKVNKTIGSKTNIRKVRSKKIEELFI